MMSRMSVAGNHGVVDVLVETVDPDARHRGYASLARVGVGRAALHGAVLPQN